MHLQTIGKMPSQSCIYNTSQSNCTNNTHCVWLSNWDSEFWRDYDSDQNVSSDGAGFTTECIRYLSQNGWWDSQSGAPKPVCEGGYDWNVTNQPRTCRPEGSDNWNACYGMSFSSSQLATQRELSKKTTGTGVCLTVAKAQESKQKQFGKRLVDSNGEMTNILWGEMSCNKSVCKSDTLWDSRPTEHFTENFHIVLSDLPPKAHEVPLTETQCRRYVDAYQEISQKSLHMRLPHAYTFEGVVNTATKPSGCFFEAEDENVNGTLQNRHIKVSYNQHATGSVPKDTPYQRRLFYTRRDASGHLCVGTQCE